MAIDNVDSISPVELSPSNLYGNGTQIVFNDGEGLLTRDQIDNVPKEGDNYHTVRNSENLYKIAYQWYKDEVERPSRWWWVIAEANKEIIFNPLDLSEIVGSEILIPNLTNFRLVNL